MNNKQMIDLGHGSMCTDAMGIFLYNTYNCSLSMIKASISIGQKKIPIRRCVYVLCKHRIVPLVLNIELNRNKTNKVYLVCLFPHLVDLRE